MPKMSLKRLIISISIVLAAFICMQLAYSAYVYIEKRINHPRVLDMVDNDLTYEWDTLDEQLELILNWIENKHLANGDMGRLYERASLIYQERGEEMTYYKFLGYALYYLEQSDEKDYTVNIYLDLANFYINNYAFDSAHEMVEQALEIESFEDIESLQVKSYAYRMAAIIAIYDEDYNEAERLLDSSYEVLSHSNTGIFEEAYIAMNDAYLAMIYLETGQTDKCQQIIDKYEDSQFLTQDVYRQVLLRDFIIPYYQVRTSLIVSKVSGLSDEEFTDNKQDAVAEAFEEFLDLCEANGYEKQELYTLLRIQEKYPTSNEAALTQLYATLSKLYSDLFTIQNSAYSNIISSQVSESKADMAKNVKDDISSINRIKIYVLITVLSAFILLYFVGSIINNRNDGLTGLLTRKTLDRDIEHVKKSASNYAIIMMDIDNFKQINDTYGHQCGDLVLERLGKLVLMEKGPDVHAYRYGGEEFVVLLEKDSLNNAQAVAERLRGRMEMEKWDFDANRVITLSLGIASGFASDDVLKEADNNLYISKQNGKNQVTCSEIHV